jgi:dihydroxyacetone kinase
MKKIINSPEAFVDEVIEGLMHAHSDELRAVSADSRALVRVDAGTDGKVGIVTGGGSGHMPFFLGYVGRGLASGVAVGNVFSSPSPQQIHAATAASDDGAGVLFLYGNYGGDVYNFDIAADLCAGDGIRTTTVLGTDDILSAPVDRAATRRGVAGLIFAYKTAGAAADRGDDLDAVTAIAQRTVNRTRTMGVGLSPTILPAAGEPTFRLNDGEMEIGIGIHGEPGQHRGPLETADEITDRFLAELIKELDLTEGSTVAVLVNGLGATPLEELYLIYRRAHEVLTELGVTIHRRYIGEYATSLEMAGASLSILQLDDELTELIDAPARSPFFTQGAVEPPKHVPNKQSRAVRPVASDSEQVQTVSNPGCWREITLAVADSMPGYADELRELDAALGDGDLGITVSVGARAVHDAVAGLPENAHPSEILKTAGAAFAAANPSTYAALVGGGLVAAGVAIREASSFTSRELATAMQAMQAQIMDRGGAQPGDKTVVDVIGPVAQVLAERRTESIGRLASTAVRVAEAAVGDGVGRVSQRGRAAWVGERGIGHKDPGSVAFLRLLQEIAKAI